MRTTRFVTAFWALARPYWVSEQRSKGLALLAAVIGLALALVWINVQINQWNNDFYNALQERQRDDFYRLLGRFTVLAFAYIGIAVYRFYLQQMLQIEWRTWLNERFLADWLKDRAYYRLQLLDRGTDNPDQRIAEDLNLFVSSTLSLGLGLLSAVVTLVSFVAILWTLSGALEIAGVLVPGYMVWFALLYAGVGSFLTHKIGRPLIGLEFNQQRFEADYRFSLVRLRENSEGVALYRGENEELGNFRGRFASVIANWWGIMRKQKQLNFFTVSYSQIAIIFPFVVAAPRYFRGEIPLGGLIQTASAFGQVQDSLSFIIGAYTDIAQWRSVVQRLVGFERTLARVRAEAAGDGVRRGPDTGEALALDRVDLKLPGGRPLVEGVTLDFRPGDTALISGPSGAGKSTLFRAIAGIWPFGAGTVRLPRGGRVLFLPQKPYLPIGTLREVISYPTPAGGFDDQALREALEVVGLPELAGRLDESGHWALQLSPGEQQRIAFARALVQKPDWLFLDEATSAVDEAAETRLYQLIHERLRGTAVLSVGHRSTLRAFHGRQLVVQPNGSAPAAIVEVSVTS